MKRKLPCILLTVLLAYVNAFLEEEIASGRIDELAEEYIYRYIGTEEALLPAA